MEKKSKQFFDSIVEGYDQAIELCVPRYDEMLWAIVYYLPSGWKPLNILELGCGSGNLSELVAKMFPRANLCLIDQSEKFLSSCRSRLQKYKTIEYIHADFSEMKFEPSTFDLVVSSIAIHHLLDTEKFNMFNNIHRWLRPGGVLAFSDQYAGATNDLYQKHIKQWKQEAIDQGLGQKKWKQWMDHQKEHDCHVPLHTQIQWLQRIGYASVDCTWRYLLWTVLHSQKS
ncbi:MAG: class I SAM-dependent methyltransferase [Nitrospirales bacterium]